MAGGWRRRAGSAGTSSATAAPRGRSTRGERSIYAEQVDAVSREPTVQTMADSERAAQLGQRAAQLEKRAPSGQAVDANVGEAKAGERLRSAWYADDSIGIT